MSESTSSSSSQPSKLIKPTPSALTELRSKQPSPPLLHLNTLGLTSWDTQILDSDDLAGLWNAFTKCKKVLSDGYRLENITWRLWQREKILRSGINLNHQQQPSTTPPLQLPSSSSPSSSSSSIQTLSSQHQHQHHQLSSPSPPPPLRLNTTSRPITSSPSLPPTSPNHPDHEHQPSSSSSSTAPKTSFDHTLPHSPTPDSGSSRDLNHILPPPRPNSITPVCLGVIIDRLLPMDIIAERAAAIHQRDPNPNSSIHIHHHPHPPDPGSSFTNRSDQLCPSGSSLFNRIQPSSGSHPSSPGLTPHNGSHPSSGPHPSSPSSTPHSGSHPSSGLHPSSLAPTPQNGSSPYYLTSPSPAQLFSSITTITTPSSCNTPSRLKAPPRIVNIAPTPPPASPAVTAPTSPVSGTAPIHDPPPHQALGHLLNVSPEPLLPPPTITSRSLRTNHLNGIVRRKPLSSVKHSSSSSTTTTTSSIGLKSIDTSPSIRSTKPPPTEMSPIATQPSQLRSQQHLQEPLVRRAYSSSGLRPTNQKQRRPLSYVRTISAGSSTITTRSNSGGGGVGPRRCTLAPKKHKSEPRRTNTNPQNQRRPSDSNVEPRLSSSPLPFSPTQPSVGTSSTSSSASYSVHHHASPTIPKTPHNSQASSIRMSKTPVAPPPTPAGEGVRLPTTMSNNNILVTNGNNQGKKKAKFFIDAGGYETEDDQAQAGHGQHGGIISPPIETSSSRGFVADESVGRSGGIVVGPSGEGGAPLKPSPREEEEEEETDEDDWDSSYTTSSSSSDHEEEERAEAIQEEIRRAEKEAYHRKLFAKRQMISEPVSTPIRRAGLSMLFHPELNDEPNTRNQRNNRSAIELRLRQARGTTSGNGEASGSIERSKILRPGSLVKSKSSVAVPVLVSSSHQVDDPFEMIERRSKKSNEGIMIKPIRRGPPSEIEYSSDESENDEDQDQDQPSSSSRKIRSKVELAAPPLSPRTTRRNMLANEMTESVRRNLLWERQLRYSNLGGKSKGEGSRVDVPGFKNFSKGFHRSGW